MENIRCLCFEGGGVLGVGHVGALSKFVELGGNLSQVDHVVGTSVGSFLAAAIGCGADFQYINNTFLEMNLKKFQDAKSLCCLSNIGRLLKNFGTNKGTYIGQIAAKMMEELTESPDITFAQAFKKFEIHTTLVYLSVNFKRTVYANHETTPDLKIREAIARSCAIPVFYQAVKDKTNKQMYVDGGVTDNYPIHVLRDLGCPEEHILGFKLCSKEEVNEYLQDKGEDVPPPKDLGQPENLYKFITRLIGIVHNQALRYHVGENDWRRTVKIDIGSLQTTDFDLDHDQIMWLYEQGRKGMEEFYNL